MVYWLIKTRQHHIATHGRHLTSCINLKAKFKNLVVGPTTNIIDIAIYIDIAMAISIII